jgi:hypothetical protein
MAILGAKKAEEERLTSIIQTRLTVLQARLNLAAIQAQLASPTPDYAEFQAHGHPHERTPSLSHSSSSAPQSPPLPHMHPVNGYYDRMPMGYDRMDRLPPIHRERSDSCGSRRRNDGLEMLLEGVREAERKERA